MFISEMFYSLQGEGTYIGVPSIFIRTASCNLRCHFCFTPNTQIDTARGRVKIKNLSIGDKVLTLKDGKLIETKVTNTVTREVPREEVIRVDIGNKKFFVTKDHPFFVKNNGWVQAKDLSVDDIIMSANQNQLNSYRMKKNNPMADEQTRKKMAKTFVNNYYKGKWTIKRSKEHREILRNRMLTNNPMKDPDIVKKQCMNCFRKQSKLEERYEKFFIANDIDVSYIGNNKLAIGDKNSRYRFPDFVVNGKNKLIEIYDSTMLYRDYNGGHYRDDKWKNKTIDYYKTFEYDCLILNEKDIKDKKELLNKIQSYIFNGDKVKSIRSLSNKQVARLEGQVSENIHVVNLTTEDHTYLCQGSLVHNCDTPYASWWNEGEQLDVNKIIDEMYEKWGFVEHVVITGGEPMIQMRLNDLVDTLKGRGHFITIETNGTKFRDDIKPDLFSISPKMSNSVPSQTRHPDEIVYKEAIATLHTNHNTLELDKFIDCGINYQIKFVTIDDTDLDEILECINTYNIPRKNVFLMPEGITKEQLDGRYEVVAEICKREKFVFCPRIHIDIWGNTRGV